MLQHEAASWRSTPLDLNGARREALRVWIDIENPPPVQYLTPLKRAFDDLGHEVVVTSVDNDVTLGLLGQRGISPVVRGSETGTTRSRKASEVLVRAHELRRAMAEVRRHLLVAVARHAISAASLLRVPSFAICGYEHVDLRVGRIARTHFI